MDDKLNFDPTVEVKKLPKESKTPKEPRFRKGLTQEAWATKLAGMTRDAVPEGWLGMAEIVKQAVAAGIKKSRICSAMGGDRGMSEPWDAVFQVVYVGGRKFGSPDILTKGFSLLQDAEYHKAVRKGRPKKEKVEGAPEKPKVKIAPSWVNK